MAAAVDPDRAARLEGAALGLDVDDAGGAQPVFRRQRAGDERPPSRRGAGSGRLWPKKLTPSGRLTPLMRYCSWRARCGRGSAALEESCVHARRLQQHLVQRSCSRRRAGSGSPAGDPVGGRADGGGVVIRGSSSRLAVTATSSGCREARVRSTRRSRPPPTPSRSPSRSRTLRARRAPLGPGGHVGEREAALVVGRRPPRTRPSPPSSRTAAPATGARARPSRCRLMSPAEAAATGPFSEHEEKRRDADRAETGRVRSRPRPQSCRDHEAHSADDSRCIRGGQGTARRKRGAEARGHRLQREDPDAAGRQVGYSAATAARNRGGATSRYACSTSVATTAQSGRPSIRTPTQPRCPT